MLSFRPLTILAALVLSSTCLSSISHTDSIVGVSARSMTSANHLHISRATEESRVLHKLKNLDHTLHKLIQQLERQAEEEKEEKKEEQDALFVQEEEEQEDEDAETDEADYEAAAPVPVKSVACGSVKFSRADINAAIKAGTGKAAGNYPHAFKNYEGLPLANKSICKKAANEFPIMEGGKLYAGGSPGKYRVLFANADGKHSFCGVTYHANQDDNSAAICTNFTV